MARRQVPHALEMRELKYGDRPERDREETARRLMALGRRPEALLLAELSPSGPLAAELRDRAVSEGQAFFLTSLKRAGAEVLESHFLACAKAAEAAGRYLDARLCYLALSDQESLARIREHLPPSLATPPI